MYDVSVIHVNDMNVQAMLSVMIVIHLSSYLSIFPDYVMSFHPLSIRKLSVFIFICIVLKKKKLEQLFQFYLKLDC